MEVPEEVSCGCVKKTEVSVQECVCGLSGFDNLVNDNGCAKREI